MFDPAALSEFDNEFSILCQLNHPNIIRVLGCGQVPRRFIVVEYLIGGSMENIQLNRDKSGCSYLGFRDAIRMAQDLASAMDYLHTKADLCIKIIHREIKPGNIGFTEDGRLKLFDFGVSTRLHRSSSPEDDYVTGRIGTVRYMAPEVIRVFPYSEKADVYSFGICLWESVAGKMFKKNFKNNDIIRTVSWGGQRPKLYKSWPPALSQLLQSCWDTNPRKRPSFAKILLTLSALYNDIVTTPCVEAIPSQSRLCYIFSNFIQLFKPTKRVAPEPAQASTLSLVFE